ncbi:MAG: hypothetical protein JO352_27545 [Chloroflexi bacterium]|nr:hypothetical protein [Chloroflexota bacterium]MBV9596402.1 hypothetical protein [Chloroflexota bacterium]
MKYRTRDGKELTYPRWFWPVVLVWAIALISALALAISVSPHFGFYQSGPPLLGVIADWLLVVSLVAFIALVVVSRLVADAPWAEDLFEGIVAICFAMTVVGVPALIMVGMLGYTMAFYWLPIGVATFGWPTLLLGTAVTLPAVFLIGALIVRDNRRQNERTKQYWANELAKEDPDEALPF